VGRYLTNLSSDLWEIIIGPALFQKPYYSEEIEADTFFAFKNDFDKFFVWAYIYGV